MLPNHWPTERLLNKHTRPPYIYNSTKYQAPKMASTQSNENRLLVAQARSFWVYFLVIWPTEYAQYDYSRCSCQRVPTMTSQIYWPCLQFKLSCQQFYGCVLMAVYGEKMLFAGELPLGNVSLRSGVASRFFNNTLMMSFG